MEEIKKHTAGIVILVISMILLSFTVGVSFQRNRQEATTSQPDIMDCDSLRNEYLEVYIGYTRDEIILDRLYKRDSVLYNELTANLE